LLLSLFCRYGLLLLPRMVSDCNSPTPASWIAGITGMYHHARLVFEVGSC
jgi:hypothetical protein